MADNGNGKKKRVMLTALEFCENWQDSEDIDEFVKRTGLSRNYSVQKASNLRRRGVDLKLHTKKAPTPEELNDYINKKLGIENGS